MISPDKLYFFVDEFIVDNVETISAVAAIGTDHTRIIRYNYRVRSRDIAKLFKTFRQLEGPIAYEQGNIYIHIYALCDCD